MEYLFIFLLIFSLIFLCIFCSAYYFLIIFDLFILKAFYLKTHKLYTFYNKNLLKPDFEHLKHKNPLC